MGAKQTLLGSLLTGIFAMAAYDCHVYGFHEIAGVGVFVAVFMGMTTIVCSER